MKTILRFNYWADNNPLGTVIAYKITKEATDDKPRETALLEAREFNSEPDKILVINNFKRELDVVEISKV